MEAAAEAEERTRTVLVKGVRDGRRLSWEESLRSVDIAISAGALRNGDAPWAKLQTFANRTELRLVG